MGIELIKDLYEEDLAFTSIYLDYKNGAVNGFYKHDDYLFKMGKLCIPCGSIRELLVREVHGGGLSGHFGVKKTLKVIKEHFYWPRMIRDVHRAIKWCMIWKKVLHMVYTCHYLSWTSHGLIRVWSSYSNCQELKEEKIQFWWLSTNFLKSHFIPCSKTDNTSHVVDLFIKKIVRWHEVSRSVILDRDAEFLSYFWRTMWN